MQLLVLCTLLAALCITTLANYWFTFGLWPKSWLAFFGFAALTIVLHALLALANKGDE